MRECIAIVGDRFTLEWYFDMRGYSQPLDYFSQTTELEQDKIIALFKYMADHGKIFNKTKFVNEGDGIYAFKAGQNRYLCFFFLGGKIILTNAFTKKAQKLPAREKEKAIAAFKSYKKRVEEGLYYE
ncbi:TPA: hypothetical protein DIC20_03055 [Candidatus Dependentiae bacterium]|nr:hypothetical protein [Candidatus Dependentiae bacterium]HCU00654.1 hypothetical protein [Candidatus Dependentiae bacterium]